MTFDAALKRVFDAAVEELTVLATEERNRAREQGTDEGRAQGLKDGHEQGHAEGHQEGHDAGHALGLEEGRHQGREEAAQDAQSALEAAVAAARAEATASLTANNRLLDGIRAIDAAHTLGEVLDELTMAAAAEAGRAGVLLAQNGRLRGYRFQGFGPPFADASSIDLDPGNARSLAEGRESFEAPLTLFGETVAVLYADTTGQSATGARVPWRDALEILTRHAARALEALTAIKTARAVAGVQPASTGHASVDERNEAESSARRYAKLLVSEIKLYHEAAVVAGRRDRDLTTRLGGEISRARVLYEQRVPAAVRDRADYFRDELVRTLANGDATLLRLS
jgi:hypothetical protein